MIPLMLYVSYQVFTKQPVVEKNGSADSQGMALRDDVEQSDPTQAASDSAASGNGLRADDLLPGIKIDPNTASWSELTTLPGIGEVTAKKIVAFREEHAVDGQSVFRCADDLDAVSGIGPKTIQKMIPYLAIPSNCDGD